MVSAEISVRLQALVWGLILISLTACFPDPGYPSLRIAPEEQQLCGLYFLDGRSVQRMTSDGYGDSSASIELNSDHTFVAKRMPSYWLDVFFLGTLREPRELYDTCSGNWTVEVSQSVYEVVFRIERFTEDSAYAKGPGYNAFAEELRREHQIVDSGAGRISHFGLPWSFDIVRLSKRGQDYGLALPLIHGKAGFLILKKKERRGTLKTNGEPDGAASRGQPVGPHTNQPSVAAGSGR